MENARNTQGKRIVSNNIEGNINQATQERNKETKSLSLFFVFLLLLTVLQGLRSLLNRKQQRETWRTKEKPRETLRNMEKHPETRRNTEKHGETRRNIEKHTET